MDEETKTLKIEFFFPSKANPMNIYHFTLYPEQNFGSLTEIANEMVRQLYTGELALPEEVKLDAMRVVQIGIGEMAADGRDYDGGGRIYYHMLNGSIIATDISTVDWDANIQHIQDKYYAMDNTRHLIVALLTKDTVEVVKKSGEGEDAENTTVEMDPLEIANVEIKKFHEKYNLNIDYSMFAESEWCSLRELAIAQLIDILEFHQQMTTATVAIASQRQIADMYEKKIAVMNGESAPAPDEPETVQAEVVSEG